MDAVSRAAPAGMASPNQLLALRLSRIAPLTEEGVAAVADVVMTEASAPKGADLVVPDEEGTLPFLVVEGWLLQHRLTDAGARQIVEVFLAGDLANLRAVVLPTADTYVTAATAVRIARFTPESFHELVRRYPPAAAAFLWMMALRRSRLFEQLLSLGRRDARGRIGHFFVELHHRAETAGLADGHRIEFPLRVADLADIVGLSPEHTSRALGRLRGQGLVRVSRDAIAIPDIGRLVEACGLDTRYLHADDLPAGGASGG